MQYEYSNSKEKNGKKKRKRGTTWTHRVKPKWAIVSSPRTLGCFWYSSCLVASVRIGGILEDCSTYLISTSCYWVYWNIKSTNSIYPVRISKLYVAPTPWTAPSRAPLLLGTLHGLQYVHGDLQLIPDVGEIDWQLPFLSFFPIFLFPDFSMLVPRAFLILSFSYLHFTPTLLSLHFISWDCSILAVVTIEKKNKNGWNLPISIYYAISRTPPYIPEPLHLPIGNCHCFFLYRVVCSDATADSQWVLSPLGQRPLWYLTILFLRTISTIPFIHGSPRYHPTEPTIPLQPRRPHIPRPPHLHLTVNATLSILFPS